MGLGCGEKLAGWTDKTLFLRRPLLFLFVSVCGVGVVFEPAAAAIVVVRIVVAVDLIWAGLVEWVVIRGNAQVAGAAACAARAAEGSHCGGARSTQAAVHSGQLQRLVDGGVTHHYAMNKALLLHH